MSGTAAERLSRLLALVPWLRAHDGVTVADAAAHFGVTPDQLEQDLWLLIVCGEPGYGPGQLVDIQFWDEEGRIHVLDALTLERPMRLSQQEALTLLIALRMLAQVPGVEDREALVTAAVKLEQAASATEAARAITVNVGVSPEVRGVIEMALASGGATAIRYASASKDEVTDRTIEPRRLFTTDGTVYLEAYCYSAGALRTFRLDRVVSAAPGQAPGPAESPGPGYPTTDPPAVPATALLAVSPEARWIIDVHQGAVEGEGADGSTLVRLRMLSPDWALRVVLSLAGTAKVLEPPELVRAVAGAARSALAAYP